MPIEMRACAHCDELFVYAPGPGRPRVYCSDPCRKTAFRLVRNPDPKPRPSAEHTAARNRALLALAEVKRRPCEDCGVCYPPYVMDLDHVRGVKLFNVSRGRADRWITGQMIMEEMAKCDVVCANCHRVRTFTRGKTTE